MPRFPHLDQLAIPATFANYVPGRLHPDGRRYLPLLVFDVGLAVPLGVVDRHHIVSPELDGRSGTVQLVFLLSSVVMQPSGEQRRELVPEHTANGRASTAPDAYGKVLAVPTWEEQRGTLQYESLYTEFTLDVGVGIVGVRTATTADSLTEALGTARIETGDWVHVGRSRIDILGFKVDEE
jgi:hypothetical protein